MKLEDSKFIALNPKKISFPFGNFFFFEKFVVSEINEGEHFSWSKIQQVIEEINRFYGENFKIAHISNRIHSYSINPANWIKFHKQGYGFVVATAVVSYTDTAVKLATLEKLFSPNSLKRCKSLEEAIDWVSALKEFN